MRGVRRATGERGSWEATTGQPVGTLVSHSHHKRGEDKVSRDTRREESGK
jgi:hypothetical protein